MIKKTITYVNFNDEEVSEDCYFNLTQAEIAEMELSIEGGLEGLVKKIIEEKDASKVIPMFKEIIAKSYGKKSEDGRRFIKSEEMSNEFLQTEAFSELLIELLSDSDKAADFTNGIVSGRHGTVSKEDIEKKAAELGLTMVTGEK